MVILGGRNPTTLTGVRRGKTEERLPEKEKKERKKEKKGSMQPMVARPRHRRSKALTLVLGWGRAEARLI